MTDADVDDVLKACTFDRQCSIGGEFMSLSISIVVPVYNEIENIDTLVDRLVTACGTLAQPWEVILVDDGSHDGSTQRADQLAEKHDGVMRSVVLNRNYGQHAAIMCGFAHTRGDVVITIDADPTESTRRDSTARSVHRGWRRCGGHDSSKSTRQSIQAHGFPGD